MADPSSLVDIGKLAGVGVGSLSLGVVLTRLLGGLLEGWISGTAGQERTLRNDLAEERTRLQTALTAAHAETDEARSDLRQMHKLYLTVLTTRAEARATLKALETTHGLPVTTWPDDPVIPLNPHEVRHDHPLLLRRIRPDLPFDVATKAAAALDRAAARFSITTPRRLAHWLAQLAQESGFRPDAKEDMARYTAANLLKLWPARFPPALARKVAGNAQAVGDIAYGGRMGNTEPGDGSKYVGRSYPQITGKVNYQKYGALLGLPFVQQPDLVLQYGAGALVAAAYWSDHGCNRFADRGGVPMVETITRLWNGGTNGLAERTAYYRTAAAALGIAA